MKLNILTTTAILALIGAAMTQSAKAQFATPIGAPTGDLILGFSTGGTTTYEIDLGSFALYQGSNQINIANVNTDLTSLFGAGYYSNTNLRLEIGGSNNLTNSVYVSDPSSTAFSNLSNGAIKIAVGDLQEAADPANANLSPAPTAGTTPNSLFVSTSNQGELTGQMNAAGFTASGTTFTGTSNPQLYLQTYNATTGKTNALGTTSLNGSPFSITSGGEIVYDAQTLAAPEPSTYALGVAGLLLLVALKRRQQSIAQL